MEGKRDAAKVGAERRYPAALADNAGLLFRACAFGGYGSVTQATRDSTAEPTIQPPLDCIKPPMSINDALPNEILLEILTRPEIDPTHIVLGRVCSRWRSVLSMAPPLRDDDI
ncbi:ankyrin repeat protein [Pandoravirus inopinatum]|uniref:Ankyrin repeat protein n=1 Tax=Pandoravirus inopinatum TaxID=1605721 RepID=A0A0B5JB31_9VIRU|nr:ankyrin repeat protein [Pandoravirus inopinatum]AJF96747.1 ankyrin repeat protein [Pandoravirus inopinatum]